MMTREPREPFSLFSLASFSFNQYAFLGSVFRVSFPHKENTYWELQEYFTQEMQIPMYACMLVYLYLLCSF